MSASLSPGARLDALTIADKLDELSPRSGSEFLDRLDSTLTVLEQFPRLYGRVRRAPRGREVRCARIGKSMYLAFYEVRGDHATIFAVRHARQRGGWQSRLQ